MQPFTLNLCINIRWIIKLLGRKGHHFCFFYVLSNWFARAVGGSNHSGAFVAVSMSTVLVWNCQYEHLFFF